MDTQAPHAQTAPAPGGTGPQAFEGQPPPAPHEALPASSSVMDFNGLVLTLTWVAFLIAFVVLGKFLWKPILHWLESREAEIRTSLDDAAAARKAAEEADAKAAQTIADAERDARAKADAMAAAARRHVAEMEGEAREAIAAKRRQAEADLADERAAAMRKLSEQAGGEIAKALDRLLPGLLTDAQRQAYQDQIAADVRFR